MKLIIGLGNPGRLYKDSRHNIGFLVVKTLSKFYCVSFARDSTVFSLIAKCRIKNQNIILALPLTFMNLSGLTVKALVKKYKVVLDNLLVVCDDLDLEFGRFKIRPSGSSGGHHGLESIIEHLKSNKFCRLRIGIGRPKANIDTADFVLSPFSQREKDKLKETVQRASDCCQSWVSEGITKTMNTFNPSPAR